MFLEMQSTREDAEADTCPSDLFSARVQESKFGLQEDYPGPHTAWYQPRAPRAWEAVSNIALLPPPAAGSCPLLYSHWAGLWIHVPTASRGTQLCLGPTAAHSPEEGRRGTSRGTACQHPTGSLEPVWVKGRDATLASGSTHQQTCP